VEGSSLRKTYGYPVGEETKEGGREEFRSSEDDSNCEIERDERTNLPSG